MEVRTTHTHAPCTYNGAWTWTFLPRTHVARAHETERTAACSAAPHGDDLHRVVRVRDSPRARSRMISAGRPRGRAGRRAPRYADIGVRLRAPIVCSLCVCRSFTQHMHRLSAAPSIHAHLPHLPPPTGRINGESRSRTGHRTDTRQFGSHRAPLSTDIASYCRALVRRRPHRLRPAAGGPTRAWQGRATRVPLPGP